MVVHDAGELRCDGAMMTFVCERERSDTALSR